MVPLESFGTVSYLHSNQQQCSGRTFSRFHTIPKRDRLYDGIGRIYTYSIERQKYDF